MGLIFLGSWLAQWVAGWSTYSQQQLPQRLAPVSWFGYLREPTFWSRTFQAWQMVVLAVGSIAVLASSCTRGTAPR